VAQAAGDPEALYAASAPRIAHDETQRPA
jgi:hypothetical protein